MKQLFRFFVVITIGIAGIPVSIAAADTTVAAYSQAELDQMLAPIALYPDSLLTTILVASTYPLDVVQASRFIAQNSDLQGDVLTAAVDAQAWDPSVKTLAQFPIVLAMMNDQLTWTQQVGNAFLGQQAAVMDSVQSLRERAQASGSLQSNQQQTVIDQGPIVEIDSYSPDTVYVPYYDPNLVYGAWMWPALLPVFWIPPPTYRTNNFGNARAGGIAFIGGGAVIGAGLAQYKPNWGRHSVYVNVGSNTLGGNVATKQWIHDASHRQGTLKQTIFAGNRSATISTTPPMQAQIQPTAVPQNWNAQQTGQTPKQPSSQTGSHSQAEQRPARQNSVPASTHEEQNRPAEH